MKATWSSDASEDLRTLEHFARPYRPCIFEKTHERLHQWAYQTGRHDRVIGSWWYRLWAKIPNPLVRPKPSHMEYMANEISKGIDARILNTILKNDRLS